MGIITKEVEVRINNSNYKYYKNLGYEIPMREASKSSKQNGINHVPDTSKTINVSIKDLPKESHAKIKILCDYCQEEVFELEYRAYLKGIEITGKSACKKCKIKKYEEACTILYGASNPNKSEKVLDKTRKTCIEKYGVNSVTKIPEFQEKRKETNIKKYGVSNPTASPLVQEKIRKVNMERYGVEHIAQVPMIIEKMKKTRLERYGVEHASQSPEIREKIARTYFSNSSVRASRQQIYLCRLYKGILNYPLSHYNVDICFPDEKIYIEYDGGGHLLNVKSGHITIEEHNHKEMIRFYSIKQEGYKMIRILSQKDFLPQDIILLQMLSDARTYFSQYPNHSWIEFSIDNSTIRNAENKQGIPYDFGELRAISKSKVFESPESIQTA